MSDTLRPHELQHVKLPCPSLSPRACSNSCPLSQWYHPTISPSVTPISYSPYIFPFSASEYASLKKKNSGIWQTNPWSDHLPSSIFNRLESYWFSAYVLLGRSPNHFSLFLHSFSSVAGWFGVAFFQTFRSLITFLGAARLYGVPIVYPNGVHLVCETFYPWGTWCLFSQWWFSRGIDMYSVEMPGDPRFWPSSSHLVCYVALKMWYMKIFYSMVSD